MVEYACHLVDLHAQIDDKDEEHGEQRKYSDFHYTQGGRGGSITFGARCAGFYLRCRGEAHRSARSRFWFRFG